MIGTRNVVLVVSESSTWTPEDGGANWIKVDREDFLAAISRRALAPLRELVKKHAPPRLLSPYQSDRAVVPSMFYGRHNEVADLRDTKKSYALFGARRIGKTSLAKRVHREIQAFASYRDSDTIGNRTIEWSSVAYVEMHRLAKIDDLWRELLAAMGFSTTDLKPSSKFRLSLKEKKKAVPLEEIEILRRILHRSSKRALFLIDEVDRAIRLDREAGYPVFSHLQSLVDDEACDLRVVLFGYEELLRAWQSGPFPLNHTRLHQIRLGPLTAVEVGQLLEEPMQRIGVRIDDVAQSRGSIRSATGGMPNLVQGLCECLLDFESVTRKRLITEIDVQNALRHPDFLNRIDQQFDQITESLPRLVAFLMSEASDLKEFKTETVRGRIRQQNLVVNDYQVDDALNQLKLYSILEDAGEDEYVFASQALKSRLKTRSSPGRLAELKQSVAVEARGRN
jgi:hypothetical protein